MEIKLKLFVGLILVVVLVHVSIKTVFPSSLL
jgi:hypothetical protein